MSAHPLDRPVWTALATRQAHLAVGDARARRLHADFGPFAAAADGAPESLAALAALAADGPLLLMEPGPDAPPLPPGLAVRKRAAVVQMTVSVTRSRTAHGSM